MTTNETSLAEIERRIPRPGPALREADSIFFVSLPKSGTVFTWNMLQKASGLTIPSFHELYGWEQYTTGYDFSCPHLYACGDYNTQLLRPNEMKYFTKGFIFGAHMQASHHNMLALKHSNIKKISVLLRDPRDAFVSWVHHLRSLGPSSRDYHSKIYSIPRSYYDWTLSEQFAYQIRTFLPITVNWVEGWLDYYASRDREIDVLFVYYDDLKRDPKRYITRMLDFHRFPNADLSQVIPPQPGEMHFRKGLHGEWRQEFTANDQLLSADLMQDRIVRGFRAAALSHPDHAVAISHQESSNFAAAAAAMLRVLKQFPNFRDGYERFATIAESAGHNTQKLRSLVSAQVSDAPEDQFIYRDELIAACEAFVPIAAPS